MSGARRSESAEVIRAIAHRWFDQVLGTCDPLRTTQVHNEHRALCNALDRMTAAPAAYGHVDNLPDRPSGEGWQGPQILEQTPSGWWLRRTDMETVGAQHVELFEPNGNKIMDTVRWIA